MVRTSLIFLFLLNCGKPAEAPSPQAGPLDDIQYCKPACDHLGQLGCEEAQPVYDNLRSVWLTCTQWCEEQQISGSFLNPRCIRKAKSCADVEAVRQTSPELCND